jgi:hypothetical protein
MSNLFNQINSIIVGKFMNVVNAFGILGCKCTSIELALDLLKSKLCSKCFSIFTKLRLGNANEGVLDPVIG